MGKEHDAWLEGLGVKVSDYYDLWEEEQSPGLEYPTGARLTRAERHSETEVSAAGAGGASSAARGVYKSSGRVSAWDYSEKDQDGSLSASVLSAEGSVQRGYEYNPATGAVMDGIKVKEKASAFEFNEVTPWGDGSASFMKAEGSLVAGYEYDPESQVEFQGVKANGSASVFEDKIQGKYGDVSAQILSFNASRKTGKETDEKNGKIFLGTANSAEAKVAGASYNAHTEDGSVKMSGGVTALSASANVDANVVVDKYGMDINADVNAEANMFKVEAKGEVRLTPKALFDNTVGWALGTTAPDFLDFGPVLGAKGALYEGAGIGFGGKYRLGVDEINVGSSVNLGFGEGAKAGLTAGWRLGPLKYAVDNKDAIVETASNIENAVVQEVSQTVSAVSDFASSIAPMAVNATQPVETQSSQEVSALAATVSGFASSAASIAANTTQSVGTEVCQEVSTAASTVSNIASSAASSVGEAAQGIASAATDTWNSLFS